MSTSPPAVVTDPGHSPAPVTDDATAAPPSRLVQLTLFLMPVLAALGPFASLTPGRDGTPYAYRVLLALAVIPALLTVTRIRTKDIRRTALFATTLMVATWGVYALSWTPDPQRGTRQVIGLLISLAGAWVAIGLTARHRSGIVALRYGYALAAATFVGIGIWQYQGGQSLWEAVGLPFNFSGNPLIGTFVNPNNYGAFLLSCLGPLLALALARTVLMRPVSLVLIGGLAWALLESTSRAGLIGLAVIVVMAVIIATTRIPKAQVPIIVIAVGLTGAAFAFSQRLRTELAMVFDPSSDSSDALRLELSRVAARYFVESNGVGIGPAGFPTKLAGDHQAEVTRVLPAHNTYLEMAAEYGLPVILPFTVLLVALAAGALRTASRTVEDKVSPVRVELIATFLAVIAAALVASSVIADPSWWLIIAYMIIVIRDREGSRSSPPEGGAAVDEG